MDKKRALKELAVRHCPPRHPSLSYVKRLQVKQRELESNREFQKGLAELKKKFGNGLNLNRLKGKKYSDAFWVLHYFGLEWGLQGFRKGKPIIGGLSIEPNPEREGVNLFIPGWILPQDIRDFLPWLEKRLTGKKVKWGTYTDTQRYCEAIKKKIKARFSYLKNRQGIKSGEAINMLKVEFPRSESTIKQAIYPSRNKQ